MEHLLDVVADVGRVVVGGVDAHVPQFSPRVEPSHANFSTYLHHVVADAFTLQILADGIHTVTLGDGAAIQHGLGTFFPDFSVDECHLLITHIGQQAVHFRLTHVVHVLETKTP